MPNQFVQSNYPRIENDFYPTIDTRCIAGFLHHFKPSGMCIDICAPDGSGIVTALRKSGYQADGYPDAFVDKVSAEWIITNPPYKRGLVDKIIMRQIERVESREVVGLAVLTRAIFDFAKSRESMFERNSYYGQIKLRFRPWWSEDRKSSPIHNYVWHIWKLQESPVLPIVMYSNGDGKLRL